MISKTIFSTGNHWTGTMTRIALGILMLPHGLQKTFGFFGGYGFTGTMNYFTGYMKMPWLLGALVIATEFIGAICLILGLATRFWSAAVIALMIGSIAMVHHSFGFFMNWEGSAKGEGFEYHIAVIALSLVALVNGAGKISVDRQLVPAKQV